jgi:hypothetical protein
MAGTSPAMTKERRQRKEDKGKKMPIYWVSFPVRH